MPRQKKKVEPEYRLRVFHYHDERQSRTGVAFSIETVKEFVSFQYEVLLEDERSGHEISFRILGLHTPNSVMPAVGPARGVRIFENLKGKYRIRIAKPDGPVDEFLVKVGSSVVELLQSPDQPFIVFSNEPIPLSI